MSDITDRVKKIVVEHLNVDEGKVSDDASFIDDLGADSLDTVELVMAFEEEFDIEIPDDAAETIQTFGDAVKFINEKISEMNLYSKNQEYEKANEAKKLIEHLENARTTQTLLVENKKSVDVLGLSIIHI